MTEVILNGCRLNMLIDTGSSVSLLPQQLFKPSMKEITAFKAANNTQVHIEGTLVCQIEIKGWKVDHIFYVGDVEIPILGMDFLSHNGATIETRSGCIMWSEVPPSVPKDILPVHTLPREIILDRGANMESRLLNEFCKELGIKVCYITAYHHQSNPVERLNRTLINMLRIYTNEHQEDWDSHVPIVIMSYRISRHESTGISPFEAMRGYPPRLPVDLKYSIYKEPMHGISQLLERMGGWRKQMRQCMNKAMERRKKTYDQQYKVEVPKHKVGELVYIKKYQYKKGEAKKLSIQWSGPFKLKHQVSEVVWIVEGRGPLTRRVHVNSMKRCNSPHTDVTLEVIRARGRPAKV